MTTSSKIVYEQFFFILDIKTSDHLINKNVKYENLRQGQCRLLYFSVLRGE